jgi:hypothetical protein
MENLFTYASLGTLAGAVTATVLVADFIKKFEFLKCFSTRCVVIVVAEGIVFLADIAAGKFTVINIPLYVLNGLLVAASAMGGYQTVNKWLFSSSDKN